MSARTKPDVELLGAKRKLAEAVDEIIKLQSERDAAQRDRLALMERLAATPPDLVCAREEILTLRKEIDRLTLVVWTGESELATSKREHDELADIHNRMVEKIQESVQLELFWKRCAEQALRLWDRAQDELEALRADCAIQLYRGQ